MTLGRHSREERDVPSDDTKTLTQALHAVLVAARDNDCQISRVKAVKLLYFADLDAVREGELPVTGAVWTWHKHGPFTPAYYEAEQELIASGRAVSVKTYNYFGHPEYQLAASDSAKPDLPPIAARLLRSAVVRLGRSTASALGQLSYKTSPMLAAQRWGKRGQLLDLDLEEQGLPPESSRALARLAEVLRNLPAQRTDEGALEEITSDIEVLRPLRGRATQALLRD